MHNVGHRLGRLGPISTCTSGRMSYQKGTEPSQMKVICVMPKKAPLSLRYNNHYFFTQLADCRCQLAKSLACVIASRIWFVAHGISKVAGQKIKTNFSALDFTNFFYYSLIQDNLRNLVQHILEHLLLFTATGRYLGTFRETKENG